MKKYYFIFGEGSRINQVICAVLINLPVFAYGASIGWMSPMTLLLQSENSPRGTPITANEKSWMASVGYLVSIPFNYLVSIMGDKIGRKITLLFISAMLCVCWILKLSSMDTWAFVLARALVGVNMAGSYVACPLYTKEISEDCIRGFLDNPFPYVGQFVSLHHWRFDELPTDIMDMSVDAFTTYIAVPYDARVAGIFSQEGKIKVNDKIIFRVFRIAPIIAMSREVCGAIPVLNFAGEIFALVSDGSGQMMTPNQQAMMLGAIQVLGSTVASSVVEKAGRKPLLFITSLVSGLSMCLLASWFLARDYGFLWPAWMPITILCVCIFCDSSGLLPLSVVVTGEIFSYKYRGTVMATAMSLASFADFLQMLFFKPLANAVGIHASFYFFGIICIAAAIYVILVLPETKQRRLEDIYEDLKTKKKKREILNRVVKKKKLI